jgi:hypothetical protein
MGAGNPMGMAGGMQPQQLAGMMANPGMQGMMQNMFSNPAFMSQVRICSLRIS